MTVPKSTLEFLEWLKEATERAWARFEPKPWVRGFQWEPGTQWTGGLSDSKVRAIEKKWEIRFSDEHRLFLRTLHATDRPGFYDWVKGEADIRDAIEGVFEGLWFDVEHNVLWKPEWGGPKPDDPEKAKQILRKAFDAAPKLIPIHGHRFLISSGPNAVLSIYQSDMILYGANMRDYLLAELKDLLNLEGFEPSADSDHAYEQLKVVPFWGEFF